MNATTSPRPSRRTSASQPAERENSSQLRSFWELQIGAAFLTTWDDFTKTKKPFVKVGDRYFSRPGGKRKWLMFTPSPPHQPIQMVVPI
jgi:hypothetical protein